MTISVHGNVEKLMFEYGKYLAVAKGEWDSEKEEKEKDKKEGVKEEKNTWTFFFICSSPTNEAIKMCETSVMQSARQRSTVHKHNSGLRVEGVEMKGLEGAVHDETWARHRGMKADVEAGGSEIGRGMVGTYRNCSPRTSQDWWSQPTVVLMWNQTHSVVTMRWNWETSNEPST